MAIDPRTGNSTYSLDELIGFAKINQFGAKSSAVLQALIKLKYVTTVVIPGLEQEIESIKNPFSGTVSEITIEDTHTPDAPATRGRPRK